MTRFPKKPHPTSWEPVGDWYSCCVGKKGHHYHQSILIPNSLRLLQVSEHPRSSLLDIGCGEGILARALPPTMQYVGVDASTSLIAEAKKKHPHRQASFLTRDATVPLQLDKRDFDSACFMLSLQNMDPAQAAIEQARLHLKPQGRLLLVLNHPCFRIPRQTRWEIDEEHQIQYRCINRYLSPLKIPIAAHPSKGETSASTLSFHHSLSDYAKFLSQAGFVIETLEEWCSDKTSEGSKSKMENRARGEFPLFLAILARVDLK